MVLVSLGPSVILPIKYALELFLAGELPENKIIHRILTYAKRKNGGALSKQGSLQPASQVALSQATSIPNAKLQWILKHFQGAPRNLLNTLKTLVLSKACIHLDAFESLFLYNEHEANYCATMIRVEAEQRVK